MNFIALRLFIAWILLFPPQANASPSRDCVESQVSYLQGQEGRVVPLDRYSHSHEIRSILDLPDDLGVRALTVICFDMGQLDEKLRTFWPSQKRDIRVHTAFENEEESVARLNHLAREAVDHVNGLLGTKAPLTVDIFVGSTLSLVAERMDQVSDANGSRAAIERAWIRRCSGSQRPGAFSKAKQIVLCIPLETGLDDFLQRERDTIVELFAHEYFHSIQLQISGAFFAVSYEQYPVYGAPGPDWLLEGSAQYIGLLEAYSEQYVYSAFQSDIESFGYSETEQCQRLLQQERKFDPKRGKRAISIIAVAKLIEHSGWESLVAFYSDIGRSFDWKSSYRRVFGTGDAKPMGC